MSKTKAKASLHSAEGLARRLADDLASVCSRVLIVGSVRRRRPVVGDIEIVCVPMEQGDLFGGQPESLLEPKLAQLVMDGRLYKGEKWGPVTKWMHVPALPSLRVELHASTAERWGVETAVRTGPEQYSKALVRQQSHRGLLRDGLCITGGWRVRSAAGETFDTPTEEAFLDRRFVAGGYIPPEERDAWIVDYLARVNACARRRG